MLELKKYYCKLFEKLIISKRLIQRIDIIKFKNLKEKKEEILNEIRKLMIIIYISMKSTGSNKNFKNTKLTYSINVKNLNEIILTLDEINKMQYGLLDYYKNLLKPNI